MTFKRGMYYERNGDKPRADKDYNAVLRYLDESHYRVTKNMTNLDIERYAGVAQMYVIVGRADKAKRIILQLVAAYPKSVFLSNYQTIYETPRVKQVFGLP